MLRFFKKNYPVVKELFNGVNVSVAIFSIDKNYTGDILL